MFKIECNGEFREGRARSLLSTLVTHNIHHLDMSLVCSDGVSIPACRTVLALHSNYIAQVRLISDLKEIDKPKSNS